MSIRTERVASVIKEAIAGLLIRDYNDPAYGFITVTEVSVTGDLRIAKVYFSIFASPEVQQRTMKMLEEEKGRMRGIVGSALRIRFTPELQFYHDATMDRVDRINRLIQEIHKDDSPGDKTSGG
jgi:ribosome-binding factor A